MEELTEIQESWNELSDLWNQFIVFVRENFTLPVAAVAVSMLATLIIGIIILRSRMDKPRITRRQRVAMDLGNAVTGRCIRRWDSFDKPGDSTGFHHAIYEYEVDGQIYQYRYVRKSYPPEHLTIYYVENPKQGFIQKERGVGGIAVLLALTVLVGFLVTRLVM